MTLEEFSDYMRRLAVKWIALCGDNEGVWYQGYIGRYHSGKVDCYGDLHIFIKHGHIATFDKAKTFLNAVFVDDGEWPNEEYKRGYAEAATNALSIIENGIRS